MSTAALWQPARACSPVGLGESVGALARVLDASPTGRSPPRPSGAVVFTITALVAFRHREL